MVVVGVFMLFRSTSRVPAFFSHTPLYHHAHPLIYNGRRTPGSYLSGKVVWVTGASSGLGEQFAISAAAGGAEGVILSGRREDALERVRLACEEARPAGAKAGGVRVLPFDMGDLEYAEKTASTKAMEEFGRVDTLVLNAGVSGSVHSSLWTGLCW